MKKKKLYIFIFLFCVLFFRDSWQGKSSWEYVCTRFRTSNYLTCNKKLLYNVESRKGGGGGMRMNEKVYHNMRCIYISFLIPSFPSSLFNGKRKKGVIGCRLMSVWNIYMHTPLWWWWWCLSCCIHSVLNRIGYKFNFLCHHFCNGNIIFVCTLGWRLACMMSNMKFNLYMILLLISITLVMMMMMMMKIEWTHVYDMLQWRYNGNIYNM